MKRLLFFFVMLNSSCSHDFLDLKSSQSQKVPVLLSDFQAILDNTTDPTHALNLRTSHVLGIIGADEFFLSKTHFNGLSAEGPLAYMRNAYNWNDIIYDNILGDNVEPYDFNVGYAKILRCHIILEGLEKIKRVDGNSSDWDNTKGSALFHRALNYYNLSQLFCEPFGKGDLENKVGLPLRLTADPTIKVNRSSLKEILTLIESDLTEAEMLLPETGSTVFRASKLAVYALKARLHLQLFEFEKALKETEKVLAVKSTLWDYNTIQVSNNYTFTLYGMNNPEVFFSTAANEAFVLSNNVLQVETNLWNSYASSDLRKALFFKKSTDGRNTYWGSYHGGVAFFTGFALDETYLIQAECLARMNRIEEAHVALNKMKINRFSKNDFQPFTANSKEDLLQEIFEERKKELVFRGVRWEDLRRLNLEKGREVTLIRQIDNVTYRLAPNDKKYVWPLPPEAIEAGGYQQNER